jgi:hypothetical protein
MMRREVLLPFSEFKNYILSTPRTASVPEYWGYPQNPASQYMLQMFFDILSLFILVWIRDKCMAELNFFIFCLTT